MLLVVLRVPESPGAMAQAARALGLAPADVQRKLAGVLPRVILADVDLDRVAAAASGLEAAGFLVATLDPVGVPGDSERVVARRLVFGQTDLRVFEGVGIE